MLCRLRRGGQSCCQENQSLPKMQVPACIGGMPALLAAFHFYVFHACNFMTVTADHRLTTENQQQNTRRSLSTAAVPMLREDHKQQPMGWLRKGHRLPNAVRCWAPRRCVLLNIVFRSDPIVYRGPAQHKR